MKLAKEQLEQAEQVFALASAQRFGDLPVPIVRSDAWQRLWQAAEEFKQELHASHPDAFQESVERCPLCQQVLDDESRSRFAAFADYFLQMSTGEHAEKRQLFEEAAYPFTAVQLDEALYEEVVKELQIDDGALANSIVNYLTACRNVKFFAESMKWNGGQTTAPDVPVLDPDPIQQMTLTLERRSGELRMAGDPDKSKSLVVRANELEARKWTADRRDQIIAEADRLDRNQRLEGALADTATTGITQKATELTQRYVTDELRAAFQTQLVKLGSAVPKVELVARPGEKGVAYYRLTLASSTVRGAGIQGVLSEGEIRTISLSAFICELSTEGTGSAVVFDDPISSLDIHNRERVATELVQLASQRQVIVFTHDLFFLMSLVECGKLHKAPVSTSMLKALPTGPGFVSQDVPWEAMKFSAHIGRLNERCQEARRLTDVGAYEPLVAQICTDLRKAVERSVEEVLLSEVVMRYRRQLHVSMIKKLAAIDSDDLDLLDRLMTDYSRFQHDQTPSSQAPLPHIDQIESDLASLSSWAKTFRKKTAVL